MKNVLIGFIFLGWAGTVTAQQEDSLFIRRIANEILTHGRSYEDLRVLTKQIGGRLSGSPQMVKAEQWGLKTVQAIHPDKAWMQQCMVPHWVRGGQDQAEAKTRTGAVKKLDVLALGNSKGTGLKGITAEAMEVRSFEELETR